MTPTRPQFEGFAGTTQQILEVLFPKRYDHHMISYRWHQLLSQAPRGRNSFPQPGTNVPKGTPNDQPTTHP